MTLHRITLEMGLSETKWFTAGQVCAILRQSGPLAFHDEKEYADFRFGTKRQQYYAVYNGLMRLRKKSLIDSCLGSDDGREVRAFRLETDCK